MVRIRFIGMMWALIALSWVQPVAAGMAAREMREGRALGVRFFGCELLAYRAVLDDLSGRLLVLQDEAVNLRRDAKTVYDDWIGVAGEAYAGTSFGAGAQAAVGTKGEYGRRAWALYARSERVLRRAENALGKLRRREEDWWRLREDMAEELANGMSQARVAAAFDAYAEAIEPLISDVRAVDRAVAEAQEEFDGVQPYIYEVIAREYPDYGVAPAEPWHRHYESSRTPRPEFNYKLRERFAAHMERAHAELHTERRNKPRRGGKTPR